MALLLDIFLFQMEILILVTNIVYLAENMTENMIRISTVRFSVRNSLMNRKANSRDPNQTAWMCRLIWICTGRICVKMSIYGVKG